MKKVERNSIVKKITEAIEENPSITQDELKEKIGVSQTTISRWLREENYAKTGKRGVYYNESEAAAKEKQKQTFCTIKTMTDAFYYHPISFCIKTKKAYANAAALALHGIYPSIIGTIAGEDFVQVFVKNVENLEQIKNDVEMYMGKNYNIDLNKTEE